MTSNQEFNCVFCKESFDNKEDLQIHFRKHGDPAFNKNTNYSRLSTETQSGDKSNDEGENVSCDVCSCVFKTISKAITHKHKVHPDHDAKYFCPWCGKLFTMKHLYNKHMQTNHESKEESDEMGYHCDYCEVDFFVPSAMVYHNKFFHRQDTELAAIGYSKKLKRLSEDLLQIYYCPFCGEEYHNKVNLHKHMGDDHIDENQSPDDVLRCPLCEAIFYHLDAYELHLTFHSSEDLYSEEHTLPSEITEFSLETVPPIMEKVENEPQEDAESTLTSMGIENFLQQAMNESADNDVPEKKSKKHKKHKKSKKSAITLDEFLNMNKDVFGEGIDFQGIEEVPSQVVAKQLKSRKQSQKLKPATKRIPSTQLQKLKKQGIIVKKKTMNTQSKFQAMKVVKGMNAVSTPVKVAHNIISHNKINPAVPTKSNAISTTSEVLSKLLSQSNSQIKIIKKSAQCNIAEKKIQHDPSMNRNSENEENDHEDEARLSRETDEKFGETNITNQGSLIKSVISKSAVGEDAINTLQSQTQYSAETCVGNKMTDGPKVAAGEDDKTKNYKLDKDDIKCNKDINALKHLSHLITVKSVNQSKNIIETKISTSENIADLHEESENEDICEEEEHMEETHSSKPFQEESTLHRKPDNQPEKIKDSSNSFDALKNLSKHIIVKSFNQSTDMSKTDTNKCFDDENDYDDVDNVEDNAEGEHDIRQIVEDKIMQALANRAAVVNQIKSPEPKNQTTNFSPKTVCKPRPGKETLKPVNPNEDIPKKLPCSNILKQLPNITTKPVNVIKNINQQVNVKLTTQATNIMKGNFINKCMKKEETKQETEIFNVDDSDDEADSQDSSEHQSNSNPNTPKQIDHKNINKSIDVLKNLSMHVTVKSSNQQNNPQARIDLSNTNEMLNENRTAYSNNFDHDTSKHQTNSNPIINTPKQMDYKNINKSIDVLKNLSMHVTVKSSNQKNNLEVRKDLSNPNEVLDENRKAHTNNFDNDNTNKESSYNSKKSDSPKNIALHQTLKNLSKHITVKSRNSSPTISMKQEKKDNEHINDNDSDSNSCSGQVQISEMDDNDASDDEMPLRQNKGINHSQLDKNPIIQSPSDSNSEYDEFNEDDQFSDIESNLNVSTIKIPPQSSKSTCLENLKNISDITVKSFKDENNESKANCVMQGERSDIPSQGKELLIKPFRQTKTPNQPDSGASLGKNSRPVTGRNVNQSTVSQKVATSSDQVNTINKEVSVKTFQTKTVIQEITTTVTKTIRTVNQTVKQEVRNTSQSTSMPVIRPQKNLGIRTNQQIKNFPGIAVRQATPMKGPQIRNAMTPVRPAIGTTIRPSNQLVGVRPGLNLIRPNNPRMPVLKKVQPSTCSPQKTGVNKPIKISPKVIMQSQMQSTKRSASEDATGHFSCFKKPKESLIPVSDVPPALSSNKDGDSSVHYASSHMSSSNFTSSTKIVKGNTVLSSTQMKSEVTASSEQLSRLSGMSGLKIVKTSQAKQATQVEEKSEIGPSNRFTLEALQKLQQQGLLVKKPRLNEDNYEHSDDDFST